VRVAFWAAGITGPGQIVVMVAQARRKVGLLDI
jgi:hypothetical protein